MRAFARIIAAAVLLVMAHGSARAAETQVAVAANFTAPAKEIAAAFRTATGHTATLSFGASGAFYAQIANGAPFEVFLSADADRPAKAENDGFAVPGSRFTYAIGRLVLYSTIAGMVDPAGAVLKRGTFAHLAIADPVAAPYGAAAVETIARLGLTTTVRPKLVTANSITNAYQFVATGAAELGFVAQSQVIGVTGGSRWLIPAALHAPIIQQAVLLRTGAANPAATAFIAFLRGPQAAAIIRRYGYEVTAH